MQNFKPIDQHPTLETIYSDTSSDSNRHNLSLSLDESRKRNRREKNREAAAKCRKKRKNLINEIRESNQTLSKENAELKTIIESKDTEINRLKDTIRNLENRSSTSTPTYMNPPSYASLQNLSMNSPVNSFPRSHSNESANFRNRSVSSPSQNRLDEVFGSASYSTVVQNKPVVPVEKTTATFTYQINAEDIFEFEKDGKFKDPFEDIN